MLIKPFYRSLRFILLLQSIICSTEAGLRSFVFREPSRDRIQDEGSSNSGIQSEKSPIILVPGDGGSQLEAKIDKPTVVHYICQKKSDDYFNLWLNLADLVPFVIDCWVDNMRLIYDPVTRTTHSPPGVTIRAPGFGNTTTIEYVDPSQVSVTGYFNTLVQSLVNIGYIRGVNIRGAPYDFRKSPRELDQFYTNFRTLIQETFQMNTDRKVVLVCHSLGCPTTLYFLNSQSSYWKNRYVKSFVTLAGPWGGAVKALKAYTSGDNLGVIVVPALTIRKEERTFPSLAYLMPQDTFWSSREVLISTGSKNYTVSNYQDFFQDIGYPEGYEMWKDSKDLTRDLVPPEVETYCLHGLGLKTMAKLHYTREKFPNHEPRIETEDGDGTVNLRSLQGCQRWIGKQSKPVYYYNYTQVDHMSVMTDQRILDLIKKISIYRPEDERRTVWQKIRDKFQVWYNRIMG